MRRLLICLLAFLMMAVVGPVWAADVYVDQDSPSQLSPYSSWASAAHNMALAVNYVESVGGTNTIHVAAGTLSSTSDYILLDNANDSNLTIQGQGSTETTIAVSVAASTHCIYGTAVADNVTIKDLTLRIEKSDKMGIYKLTGADGWLLQDVDIRSSSAHNHHAVYNTGDTLDMTRVRIFYRGVPGTSKYPIYYIGSGDGTLQYVLVSAAPDADVSDWAVFYGSGVVNLNNCLFIDSQAHGVAVNNGTLNVNNSFIAGGMQNSAAYAALKAGGTLNVSNSYLMGNPFNGGNFISATADADSDNLKGSSPYLFANATKPGYIIPCVDDSGNIAYAQSVEALLEAKGMKGTFFIEQIGWDTADNAALATMVSDGTMEAAAHSYSHTNLTYDHALNFSQSGGSNCTVAFDGTDLTLDCDGATYDQSIDVTDTSYDTVGEIITALNGNGGWTVAKSSTDSQTSTQIIDGCKASGLATLTATAPPVDIDFDRTGYNAGLLKDEITDPKSWLTTLLSGTTDAQTGSTYVCDTFGYPYNAADATTKTATDAAGFTNARNTGDYVYTPDINLHETYTLSYSQLIGASEAETRQRARAVAWAASRGWVVYVLSHNTGEISLANWGYILDEWAKFGSTVNVTSSQLYADAVLNDGNWTDDGDGTYSRDYGVPDLNIGSDSVFVNAGVEAAEVSMTGSVEDGLGVTRDFPGMYNLNIGVDQTKFNTPKILGGKFLGGKFIGN